MTPAQKAKWFEDKTADVALENAQTFRDDGPPAPPEILDVQVVAGRR